LNEKVQKADQGRRLAEESLVERGEKLVAEEDR